MARNKPIEVDADGDALCARQPPDRNLAFIKDAVDAPEVLLGHKMDLIVDSRILAYPAFEARFDDFADELNGHPSFTSLAGVSKRFRRGLRADLRDHPVEIMIALRNTDEASYLSDAITAAMNDGDAGCDGVCLPYAYRRTCDASDPAKECWTCHALEAGVAGGLGGGGASNACGDREFAKKRVKSSIAPSLNSGFPPALDSAQ